jgi:CheY-like chemotaxis protein
MTKKTVLVINDDPATREMLTGALERSLGIRAIAVRTCEEAYRYLDEASPVLVLLDSCATRAGCLAAVRKIREMPRARTLPIVALSETTVTPRLAREAGCDVVLPRSLKLDCLVGTVADFIGIPA